MDSNEVAFVQDHRREVTHIFVAFIKIYLSEHIGFAPLYSIFVIVFILATAAIVAFYKKKKPDYLAEAFLLAKMNIIRSSSDEKQLDQFAKIVEVQLNLHKTISDLKEDLRTDTTVVQAWTGSFDFMYCGKKIEGSVEIANTRSFTRKENNDWIIIGMNPTCRPSEPYLSQIITYGTLGSRSVPADHIKYYEWDGVIHCKIQMSDTLSLRYLTSPRDILIKHGANISWKRTLLPRQLYLS
jgi:hypothetical protein